MATVAFIGLGVMGAPMAGHLAAAGHSVRVWNRSRSRLDAWLARHAGAPTASPREAAQGAEFVFTCVGDDPDVEAVVCGEEGVLAGLAPGGVWIDHTTCSATLARRLAAEASALGVHALDAPVSGGQAGAENAALTVMVGGKHAAYARAEPVMRSYAQRVRLLGDHGAGQLTKMVNQICIAGLLQGLAEGLHFGERAGLDLAAVVEVLSAGAAQSWQMDNRHRSMAAGDFDFGFAVEWMRKDLRICLDEARNAGTALPVAALVDQFYAEVMAMGGARWDTSSLIARLRRRTGEPSKEIHSP
ncbi:MAG: NAD(P)-dependent oxidoreductase [Gammaproteobacteria bacterium]|nr:NAD(P)-dependent oxidoreductase [Gammaproteobacteria bacterium]TVQ47458.1 MAG: NAD(P)-dependent oxidoreductase [Gammaproteobacteria bacterium]